MFRDKYPVAWHFHRNSSRWPHKRPWRDPERTQATAFKEDFDRPWVDLPPPQLPAASLATLLATRASCRRYSPIPLTAVQISALLFATYGCFDTMVVGGSEQLNRPVPSGGGLYPLEIYPIILKSADVPAGIYHFNPLTHGLAQLAEGAPPPDLLTELFVRQPCVSEAGGLIVIAAVLDRLMWKYEDRGYRYILLEAGHAAQNATLAAGALGLGALSLGGFFDLDLAELLRLDPEIEIPVYAVAIGAPETTAPETMRLPRDGHDVP